MVLFALAAVFLFIVVGLGAGAALWYFKPWTDKPKANGEVALANSDAEKPDPEMKRDDPETKRGQGKPAASSKRGHRFWDASVGSSEIDNILREMSAHQTGYLFVNSAGKFVYLPKDDPKGALIASDQNALLLWSANQIYPDVNRLGPKTVVIRRFPLSRAECARVLNDGISGITLAQAQKQNEDNIKALDNMQLPDLPEEREEIEKLKRLREDQERRDKEREKERLAREKRDQEEGERLAREEEKRRVAEEKQRLAENVRLAREAREKAIERYWGAFDEWQEEVRRTGQQPSEQWEKKWQEKWGPIPTGSLKYFYPVGLKTLYTAEAIAEMQEEDRRLGIASKEWRKKWREKWDKVAP